MIVVYRGEVKPSSEGEIALGRPSPAGGHRHRERAFARRAPGPERRPCRGPRAADGDQRHPEGDQHLATTPAGVRGGGRERGTLVRPSDASIFRFDGEALRADAHYGPVPSPWVEPARRARRGRGARRARTAGRACDRCPGRDERVPGGQRPGPRSDIGPSWRPDAAGGRGDRGHPVSAARRCVRSPTGRSACCRPSPTRPSSPSRTRACSPSCRAGTPTSPRPSSSRRRRARSCG